jgi:hypothetical protein
MPCGCRNFPKGSRQYFWYILYMYKPYRTLYDGPQPMIEHPYQAPEEVCVQDGLVCGNCFRLGTKGAIFQHKHELLKCERCKVVSYCNRDCQRMDSRASQFSAPGEKRFSIVFT